MRVISCMILLVLCTTLTGCSLFKKNTNGAPGSAGVAPPKFPGVNDPLMNSSIPSPPAFPQAPPPPTTPMSSKGGQATILAGTVTDAFHRPLGNTYIRWVNLEDKEAATPIDVAADARGHFIIQGVKTGASYKLIARTKQGEKMLAGTVLTNAPNVHLMIQMREDLVNASTPPLPTGPAYQAEPGAGLSKNTDLLPKGFYPGPKKSAVEPNLPATMTVPAAPREALLDKGTAPTFVPNIADSPGDRLPMMQIPGKSTNPAVPIDPVRPALPSTGDSKFDTGPARVPSCVLIGNHLENLALKDSKGQTWEYRKQARGKLVLLDFWATHCVYCRDSMPTLNRLQQQYGSRGFEVIGIAIEKGADERREAEAVNKVCSSLQISYRQLMGRAGAFDASKQFKVDGLPTLMLVTEQGDIIWHHVGRPDSASLSALERAIQGQLAHRPF